MDQVFAEVAGILFGDGASELIAKANPDGMDLSTSRKQKKLQRRQAQVGYASNIVGLAAGIGGTAAALRDDRFKDGGKFAQKLHRTGKKIPSPISGKSGKAGAALAGGALGLQIGNIAGDAVANRVLARAKKKEIKKSKKGKLVAMSTAPAGFALGTATEIERRKKRKIAKNGANCFPTSKGKLIQAGGKKVEPQVRGKLTKLKDELKKSQPVVEIAKTDDDKRQVFGWASVVEKHGEPVFDLQGDYIPVEEMEKAAYSYVRKSRKAGDEHRRIGDEPHIVGEMIESIAITPEKKQALGLPESSPTGWWIGLQIEDEDLWRDIKAGKKTGFSVHGRGVRTAV